jgi:hypothetical protein
LPNYVIVLQHIPPEDMIPEVDLHDNSLLSVKTHGMLWKAKYDIFTFKASPPENEFKYETEFCKENCNVVSSSGLSWII